ncbi:MAG: SDR family NAD(P)-dependent oxidoreductase [Micromonosporaceae bacterium]
MSRYVVVSGGGTGIGLATARHLAAAGDQVVIVGRRSEVLAAAAEALNDELGAQRVTWLAADLSDPEQAEWVASAVIATEQPVDVLVNNAGGYASLGTRQSLADHADAWRRDFDANVLTAVLLTTALEPHLTRPGGRVITISSIAALRGAGAYGAAKAALHAWSADLAAELGPAGITVNIVAPGYVANTEFFGERLTPAGHELRVGQTLIGRAGEPVDIAAAVAYLASADAGYVTGQILQVNGGALLGRG